MQWAARLGDKCIILGELNISEICSKLWTKHFWNIFISMYTYVNTERHNSTKRVVLRGDWCIILGEVNHMHLHIHISESCTYQCSYIFTHKRKEGCIIVQICAYSYLYRKIFEYIRISEYSSHPVMNTQCTERNNKTLAFQLFDVMRGIYNQTWHLSPASLPV